MQLRENPYDFFLSDENATFPKILCTRLASRKTDLNIILSDEPEFKVLVEKNQIFQTKDFTVAFQVYLASFYIFNFLIFVQKYVLNIFDDGIKALSRVLSMITKAKNL